MRRSNPALAVLIAACASAGASYKSGVAPKSLDKPPFYAGAKVPNVAGVAYLPIRYQADRSDPKGDAGSPAATLVTEMNAYLDSIATFAKLLPNVTEVGTAPDVHFGCGTLAGCISDGDENADHRLQLWVGRPSPDWMDRIGTVVMSALGVGLGIKDEDSERLRTFRRDDLSGQPLVWQVALRNLVSRLTGRVG